MNWQRRQISQRRPETGLNWPSLVVPAGSRQLAPAGSLVDRATVGAVSPSKSPSTAPFVGNIWTGGLFDRVEEGQDERRAPEPSNI